MKSFDYAILGNSLFSLTLTYYIALEQPEYKVVFGINTNKLGNKTQFFLPSFFLLPFSPNEYHVNAQQIEKSKELLQEIEINHRNIERKNMLYLIVFEKNAKHYSNYIKYIEEAAIPYSSVESREIIERFPFINKPHKKQVLELITQGYLDRKELWRALFDELEQMENVEITNLKKEGAVKLAKKAEKWAFMTDLSIFSNNFATNNSETYITQYPPIQQFPAVCIENVMSETIIWRDFEGILWSYSRIKGLENTDKVKEKITSRVLNDLAINELPIIDTFSLQDVGKVLLHTQGNNLLSIFIPQYLQLSLSPIFSLKIATLLKEKTEPRAKEILAAIKPNNSSFYSSKM